ncbi:glycosyltransferase family protein [Butyrivibrio proteoclasticus]|uniref:glycosyltransferase family protein n=1 Tax=Butyrivibrio proteoclasticus TaxID=43305 RepID=UPI00047DEA68|nr:DUF3880 domain-containing protein [Butyrivibrio proteoclasticus]
MNILLFDMGSYMYYDIRSCLEQMGHEVRTVYYSFEDRLEDDYFSTCFVQKIDEKPVDLIFSINFFPLVAQAAKEKSIPYVSWTYDSPISEDIVSYFEMDTNFIFLFDRAEALGYRDRGYSRVFHMPLAVNVERIRRAADGEISDANTANHSDADDGNAGRIDPSKYACDISFVGQLYDKQILTGLMMGMDEYEKGYIDGAMNVQLSIYGEDLLSKMISGDLVNRINKSYEKRELPGRLSRTGLITAIERQITFAERVTLLGTFGEYFDTRFYNTSNFDFGSDVKFMGPVKYMNEMPMVFKNSKLNLCPAIRSIVSGIPLRALDVMASGGALLSNYQVELAESFVDEQDVIMYTSLEEAFEKAGYYLEHEDERLEIARNGQAKVAVEFELGRRLEQILSAIKG